MTPLRRAWPAKVPGPREGESLSDAILRLRHEIGMARGELQQIKTAPPPAAEIKAALVAEVDRMAAEGKPRVSIDGGRIAIHWPDVQPYAVSGAALAAPSGSGSKMLAALFGDQLKKLLTAGSRRGQGRDCQLPSGRSACARSRRASWRWKLPRSGWSWPRSRRAWRFIVASTPAPWAILYAEEEAAHAHAEAAE